MNYKKIYPRRSLQQVVQFFWDFEGNFSDSSVYTMSSVASICPKLAFQYVHGMVIGREAGTDPLFTSGFQSQTGRFYKLISNQQVGVFGVYFHPHAIPLLFDIPANEITDHHIEISDLLGKEGTLLEEQVFTCTSLAGRIKLISDYLEHRLRARTFKMDGVISAMQHIITQQGQVNMQQLLDEQFLSQRQFERNFKLLTGFPPKYFSRIVRFESCIGRAYRADLSLTEIALEAGYFDQAHMIREFKEFSGSRPSVYFAEDNTLFV